MYTRDFTVYFSEDGKTTEGAGDVVRAAADYRDAMCPAASFTLLAGTDTVGSPDESLARSRAYADTVRALLVSRGVSPDRITITATGETQIAVRTGDEVSESLNRRVAITYSTPQGPSDCL